MEGTWLELSWKVLESSPAQKAFWPLTRKEPEQRTPPPTKILSKQPDPCGAGLREAPGVRTLEGLFWLKSHQSGQSLRGSLQPPPPSGYLAAKSAHGPFRTGQKIIRAESLGSQPGRWVCTLPSRLPDLRGGRITHTWMGLSLEGCSGASSAHGGPPGSWHHSSPALFPEDNGHLGDAV